MLKDAESEVTRWADKVQSVIGGSLSRLEKMKGGFDES